MPSAAQLKAASAAMQSGMMDLMYVPVVPLVYVLEFDI